MEKTAASIDNFMDPESIKARTEVNLRLPQETPLGLNEPPKKRATKGVKTGPKKK